MGPKPEWARDERRRGRAASLEHPRQPVRGRRRRLHRRHAGDPRSRRPEPRRLRLPRRPSSRPTCGSSASSRPATGCASCRSISSPRARSPPRAGSEIAELASASPDCTETVSLASPVVMSTGEGDTRLVARLSGDTHLLLEIGPPELDLVLRFRAHALMQAIEAEGFAGLVDLTPGIRSLQLHYDARNAAAGRAAGAHRRAVDRGLRPRRSRGALAHRAPAAVLGRSRLPARDREVHDHGAQGRAVVPEQPRVHPPHQRARRHRRRCARSSSPRTTW